MKASVPFVKRSCPDNLSVAGGGREVPRDLTSPLPAAWNRGQTEVGEARPLRPNPSVEHPDNDIIRIIRVGPEPRALGEAEEAWGTGGVEVADGVGDHGKDPREAAEGSCLGGGEAGGETGGGAVVGVEEVGRSGEDGGVPVAVGGEVGGLVGCGDVDDEGLLCLLLRDQALVRERQEEEEEDDDDEGGEQRESRHWRARERRVRSDGRRSIWLRINWRDERGRDRIRDRIFGRFKTI